MAKKRKYFIDVDEATEFLSNAYGLTTKIITPYQLQIYREDTEGVFNWYHTQGSVVYQNGQICKNLGKTGDYEELVEIINGTV